MAEFKPLVINSTKPNIPATDSNGWKVFTKELHSHAKNIATSSTQAADLGAIVSGIPTVFARANLFKLALETRTTGGEQSGSLNDYYARLLSEWKGLIACIALQYQSLRVERVYLRYSQGVDLDERPEAIYEPKGAFGTMLFDDRAKWCEVNTDEPFIDIIKFGTGADQMIVGATSPESLLFTSVDYDIQGIPAGCPFITRPRDSKEQGRFIDPVSTDLTYVHDKLTREQCCTLYAYVNYLIEVAIPLLTAYYRRNPALGLDNALNNVTTLLKSWLGDIADYADTLGCLDDSKRASIPNVNCFLGAPFNTLFNYSEQLWSSNGHIYGAPDAGRIPFDPKALLIAKDKADVAEIYFPGASQHLEQVTALPIVVLPAVSEADRSRYKYFSLPFTPLAVKVFGEFINELVSNQQSTNIQSRLRATYAAEGNKTILKVELTLRLDDAPDQLPKSVKQQYVLSGSVIRDKDIVVWPNFVSRRWKRYFMYSEIPGLRPDARTCPYTLAPFTWDTTDGQSMPIIEEDTPGVAPQDKCPLYINKLNVHTPRLDASMRVVMDGRSQDTAYKYEIYESSKPFRGVKLTANVGATGDTDGGFIIIDYSTGHIESKLNTEANVRLEDVNVGIDFGSTNTSVAYCNPKRMDASDNSDWLSGLTMHNRRVHLLTRPQSDDEARPRDIFFFPRMTVLSNSLKSILATHDACRLPRTSNDTEAAKQQQDAITGGFPCFESNLPIQKVTENGLFLAFDLPTGTQEAQLSYNMKWSSYELDQAHIRAYLRMILLCTYAELFDKNLQPIELKWSYPSSMDTTVVSMYQGIWQDLADVQPIVGDSRLTIDSALVKMDDNGAGVFQGTSVYGGGASAFGGGEQPSGGGIFGGGNPFGGGQSQPAGGSNPFGAAPESARPNNPFARNNDGPFGSPAAHELSEVDTPVPTAPNGDNYEALSMNNSLTESEAVATFVANQNLGYGALALCFDVGGSTTDFSVLCNIMGHNTMVKQNSIRFAAQRVSAAAVHSTRFKNVVEDMLQRSSTLRLDRRSLDAWNPARDNSKAPYFFEKVVDGLAPNELPEFYRKIHSLCPELFAVNLYVTGLIMFYAGQITKRLITDLGTSGALTQRPTVSISFAGKGARIFEWLYYIDPEIFQQYYIMNMYARGLEDGTLLAAVPSVAMPLDKAAHDGSHRTVSDIKYEVSKGLALTFRPDLFKVSSTGRKLVTLKDRRAIEILGEDNFVLTNSRGDHPLRFDNYMTGERMQAMGRAIHARPDAERYPKFRLFCGIFYQLVNNSFVKLDMERFARAIDEMKVEDYIVRTKEYIDAENASKGDPEKFHFVAPLIIMEGMNFYDTYLMPLLHKN